MGGASRAWDCVLHLNQDVVFLQRALLRQSLMSLFLTLCLKAQRCTKAFFNSDALYSVIIII